MNVHPPATDLASTANEPEPNPKPRLIRTRRITLRVIYVLVSAWILMMASGLLMLLVGDVPDGPYGFAAASTTAWKLLSCGGFLVLAWTAGRSIPAAQWVVVGQATWLAADLIAPQDPTEGAASTALRYVVNTLILLGPWLFLAPERRGILRLQGRPDRLAVFILVLLAPMSYFWARGNASLSFPDMGEAPGREITFDLVGLAIVCITVGLFAAFRPRSVRWLLGTVSAALAYLGCLSLLFPRGDLASPGPVGGLILLAASVFFGWRALRGVPNASSDRRDVGVPPLQHA